MTFDVRADMIKYLNDKLHDDASKISLLSIGSTNALRIIELLQQPVMPEQPTDELLQVINRIRGNTSIGAGGDRCVYQALRAALTTPPKPKMKTVWKFSYTFDATSKACATNRVHTHYSKDNVLNFHGSVTRNAGVNKYSNISPIWSEEVEDK